MSGWCETTRTSYFEVLSSSVSHFRPCGIAEYETLIDDQLPLFTSWHFALGLQFVETGPLVHVGNVRLVLIRHLAHPKVLPRIKMLFITLYLYTFLPFTI